MKSSLLIILILFTALFFSCKKNDKVTSESNIVSGKLKSVVKTFPTSPFKIILTVEYDSLNRVTNFSNWYENTSTIPAQISNARYRHFEYSNSNQYPSKCITTHENGKSDTSLFSYDILNRIIQTDEYPYSDYHRKSRYQYINSNLIVILDSTYIGGSPSYTGKDSLTISNDKSVLAWRNFDTRERLFLSFTYTYDDKQSPFYELNIFKYIYLIGDLDVGYNSMHNFINFRRVVSGSTDHVITNSYTYSTNSFPVIGLGQEGYDPAHIGTSNTTYTYY